MRASCFSVPTDDIIQYIDMYSYSLRLFKLITIINRYYRVITKTVYPEMEI